MVSDALTVACYRPSGLLGRPRFAMLIICPNCATSYQVEASSLGATGRSVRCVRCKKVWFTANTEAMAAISLSHQADLATLVPSDEPPAEAADAPLPTEGEPEPPALDRETRRPGAVPEPREYETPTAPVAVDDAPALVPSAPDEPQAATDAPVDIETVAARRTRRPPPKPKSRWPVPGWAT